jgi:peptide/nickel transport system permease protein
VLEIIKDRLPLTVEIVLLSVVLAVTLAIPLGVISAVNQDNPIDYGTRLFTIFGLSLPDFVLGTMTILFLSVYLGWLPALGWYPPWEDPVKNIQALIFPALILGYRLSAISARMMRSTMLDVMREDYVRTARAKGLGERTIIFRHALRNALIPVITIMAGQIAFLFGGTVVEETIFALPGLGRLTLDAVSQRDYTVVQGTVMMMAVVFVTVNLVVDLMYGLIDPRIRYT